MRIVHLTILFFLLSCSRNKSGLIIQTQFRNERIQENCLTYSYDLLKNGKVIFKYPTTYNGGKLPDTLIKTLKEGNYEIRYRGFFIEEIIQPVVVYKDSITKIVIIPDSSKFRDNIKKSFLFNLQENEKVTFRMYDNGCFNADEFYFTIRKDKQNYKLEYKKKFINLTKQDMDFLICFECELDQLPESYCTSSMRYVINYKTKSKTYTDMTCAWKGWERIRMRFML